MKLRLEVSLVLLVVGGCVVWVQSQDSNKTPNTAPQLKLKIIPSKETYSLNDRVFTKSELTNLTDKTLCFPQPVQDCESTDFGSLVTTGEAVATDENERFICHLDGRSAPREQLLREIDEKWVKVAPGTVYTSNTSEAQVSLSTFGRWRLRASYHPPEAAFGNANQFRTSLQSAAQSFGCVVPEKYVSAEPVIITVVPATDQK
jgi:hypothetical protein